MNQEYVISEIEIDDLDKALRLVWGVFLAYEAPDYVDEGIMEFKQYIEQGSIRQKLMENQLLMWVCKDKDLIDENRQIKGVLATRPPCHISLLFVDGEYQRKGIARALLGHMVDYYRARYDYTEITVNSSPYAKEAYHRLGFSDTDTEQTVNGIRFTPMKRPLNSEKTHVRTAGIEDAERISHVLASSWKTAYRGIVHDDYLDALKADHWITFLTTGLNSGSIFSMVIENDQEMIGAAILSRTEKEREVNLISFYLLPYKIGQGFGHTFYSSIETELRARGFLTCVVDVLETNARAIRFYETYGFTTTGEDLNVDLGERNYVCKVLAKSL